MAIGQEQIESRAGASSYHDTPDRRLLRAGITLRDRVENGIDRWQLKLPSAGSRLELEEPGGDAAPPPTLARLLSGILHGAELEPIAILEPLPDAPTVDPDAPALDHLRTFIRAQLDELRANDPIVRATDDAEALHDMRVAVRRLRSVLRTARPMLDRAWVEELRDELDQLGEALGAVRDLDVLIGRLTAEASKLGADAGKTGELLAPLESDRDRARARLSATMDERRYYLLLDRLEAASGSLPVTRTDLDVLQLAKKEFEKLVKFEQHAALDDDRQLHKLRIHGKRARYAAELARSSRGSRAARFIKVSKKLQDLLGQHQDAVVALGQLRRLARTADSRASAFTAGRLTESEEQRKLEARDAFPRIWKRVRKRGKAAW